MLLIEDLVELVGDVLVDAAEVVLLPFLPPALTDPLEQLLHALDVPAVAVLEALLQEPAQRRSDVAVVEQVVGDLRQDRVRVEVEAGLGAVPTRVLGSAPRGGPTAPGRSPVRLPRPC